MKMVCLKMRLTLILIVLGLFSQMNLGLGQDNLTQPGKFTVVSRKYPEPGSQKHKFKITLSDSWLGRDKVHHFLTSAFLSGTSYYFCREGQNASNLKSKQQGFCFSFSLGLAKEIRDGFTPQNAFSVKDLVADVLGTLAGIALFSD